MLTRTTHFWNTKPNSFPLSPLETQVSFLFNFMSNPDATTLLGAVNFDVTDVC